MPFYYFPFSAILNAITSSILGFFVLFKNPKSPTNRSFFYFAFSVSFWSYAYFLWQISNNANSALFWCRILMAGAIFISPAFLHFCVNLINERKRYLNAVIFWYFVSFVFLLLDFTPLYIADVRPRMIFPYWPSPGPAFAPFLVMFFGVAVYSHVLLLRAYKNLSEFKRNQIKYVFLGTAIGFLGGSTNYPLWYDINILPIGNALVAVYVATIAYAIVRHQLMDIEVLIKKTLIFASLFAIVLGIFVGITVLTQELIAGGRLLGLAISSIIIIFSVRPLEDFLVKVTDKYLFQKRYDYKQVLKSFIDEVITVLNLDRIVESTIDLLGKTLRPASSDILLLNRYEDKYVSYNALKHDEIFTIGNDAQLVGLLKTTKDIFSLENAGSTVHGTALRDTMKKLKAQLAIPLMLHDDLIGIMLLGKKKSDETYTKEDLDILTDLARTEAVAIGNAQLFAETAQNERRAAIGTLAAGINHEVGNPLNIINTKMQIYLMSMERGLYKDKEPQEIIEESRDIMKTCLRQTTRISDITKKLSNFAKPSKEFKPEVTDIEEQLEETLSVVGHELELERIGIKRNIQRPLPKIMADKRQIEQIFFNLIKNAGQAIKEKGTIEIKAGISQEKNGRNVKIEISDTGQGIPGDKLQKIFDPFYTTKAPGKGTGLGLSIVRQLVWRNKGEIKVQSKVGGGTIFTITFPEGKAA